jgi:hypothetical protein
MSEHYSITSEKPLFALERSSLLEVLFIAFMLDVLLPSVFSSR